MARYRLQSNLDKFKGKTIEEFIEHFNNTIEGVSNEFTMLQRISGQQDKSVMQVKTEAEDELLSLSRVFSASAVDSDIVTSVTGTTEIFFNKSFTSVPNLAVYCYNADYDEIGFKITSRTTTGFTITPDIDGATIEWNAFQV